MTISDTTILLLIIIHVIVVSDVQTRGAERDATLDGKWSYDK